LFTVECGGTEQQAGQSTVTSTEERQVGGDKNVSAELLNSILEAMQRDRSERTEKEQRDKQVRMEKGKRDEQVRMDKEKRDEQVRIEREKHEEQVRIEREKRAEKVRIESEKRNETKLDQFLRISPLCSFLDSLSHSSKKIL
jgi:hypothetical protein